MKIRREILSIVILGFFAASPGINRGFAQTTTETYNQAMREYQENQAIYQKQQTQYQQQMDDYQKQLEAYRQQSADYQKQQADYVELTKMFQQDHQRLKILLLTQIVTCLGICAVLVWFWNQRSRKMSDSDHG